MVNVLCIGMYKKAGKFDTDQWKCFIEWCKKECNKVIIYSRMSYNIISNKFSLCCSINQLKKPDKYLNVHAYEINIIDVGFWDYIKDYDYNIDNEEDISHMFFFQNEKYFASLEIVDYENYILIEDSVEHKLFLREQFMLENNRFCLEGKSDIEALLKKESWKPLGDG